MTERYNLPPAFRSKEERPGWQLATLRLCASSPPLRAGVLVPLFQKKTKYWNILSSPREKHRRFCRYRTKDA